MSKKKSLYFTTDVIVYPLLFVFMMWIVFWVEVRFSLDFNYLGVRPKEIVGLRGVVLSPFIHSSLKHLFNNSVPMMVLMSSLFYFYRNIRWKVFIGGLLLTGLLTWIIGRPAVHIGASGVVYMLAAFLFFKGIFSKQYQLTALSFVVVFLYGSLIWYLFPIDAKISWEGHLSGFLVGLVLSLLFRQVPIENKKYAWEAEDYNEEDDAFLRHFDEDGNFIEKLPETEEVQEFQEEVIQPKVKIFYTIRKKESPSDEDSL